MANETDGELTPEVEQLLGRAMIAALRRLPEEDAEAWDRALSGNEPGARATIDDGWVEFTRPGLATMRINVNELVD